MDVHLGELGEQRRPNHRSVELWMVLVQEQRLAFAEDWRITDPAQLAFPEHDDASRWNMFSQNLLVTSPDVFEHHRGPAGVVVEVDVSRVAPRPVALVRFGGRAMMGSRPLYTLHFSRL